MQQCCQYCGKTYTRKASYTRHVLICEILVQSKHQSQCFNEETSDMPGTRQLYSIIQELVVKCNKLESDMSEIKRTINKRTAKIDVAEWLNKKTVGHPEYPVLDWIKQWKVSEDIVYQMMSSSNMVDIFRGVMSEYAPTTPTHVDSYITCPIYCNSDKAKIFYIYDKYSEEEGSEPVTLWKQCDDISFTKILKYIHKQLVSALTHWATAHEKELHKNENLDVQYNQAILKLMSVDFKIGSSFKCKIKGVFYSLLKREQEDICSDQSNL